MVLCVCVWPNAIHNMQVKHSWVSVDLANDSEVKNGNEKLLNCVLGVCYHFSMGFYSKLMGKPVLELLGWMSLYIIENGSQWLHASCILLSLCPSLVTIVTNAIIFIVICIQSVLSGDSVQCGAVQINAIKMQLKPWQNVFFYPFYFVVNFCFILFSFLIFRYCFPIVVLVVDGYYQMLQMKSISM